MVKWVLSNQSAHTAAQPVQMGDCLLLLGILKRGKGPPTMEVALSIWLLYRKLHAAGLGEKEQRLIKRDSAGTVDLGLTFQARRASK